MWWLLILYLMVMAVVAPILGLVGAVVSTRKGRVPRWVAGPNVFFGVVSTLLLGPAALLVAAEVGNDAGSVITLVYAVVAIPFGLVLAGVAATLPKRGRLVTVVGWFSLAFHLCVAVIGTWSAFATGEQLGDDSSYALYIAGPCVAGVLFAGLLLLRPGSRS